MIRRRPAVRALVAVLGAGVTLVAVARGGLWALLAVAGGAAALFAASRLPPAGARRPPVPPLDLDYILGLLLRAHDGRAAWVVGLEGGDVFVEETAAAVEGLRNTGVGLAQLASVDGRAHVQREEAGTFVGVGEFPLGLTVLLRSPDAAPPAVAAATGELRRLAAGLRVAEVMRPEPSQQLVTRRLALHASGTQTLGGIARAGADLAQDLAQRPAAVVIRGAAGGELRVVGLSAAADRRLRNLPVVGDAPVARAVDAGVPVVTHGDEDILGPGVPERRRRERAGTAYPLLDGHVAVGALVLFGAPIPAGGPLAEQVGRLVVELSPRVAAARAVHDAERRAVSDPLTGLANRREFDRALAQFEAGRDAAAAVIYADLDHFKRLNDTLGHAAGDAALRHVKAILEAHSREGDVVARIGGEEFAIWLPGTSAANGWEVAERIRRSIEHATWQWSGAAYPLTISCGVAAMPEHTREVDNLRALADAALYRAKARGRNRVESAAGVAADVATA